MATNTVNSQLTFTELAKRTDGGSMLPIAEVLSALAPILNDIPWFQCNQILAEKIVRRHSLPSGTWRKANQGVASEASSTDIVLEQVALLEARSVVDEDIIDNAPNPMQARRDEDMSFVEGMAQEYAKTLVQGTTEGAATSAPEEIEGLAQRLNDLDQTTVIDGGGSGGDTTSIYVVKWGKNGAYGIYPAAAANRGTLGLSINDKGKEAVIDSTTNTTAFYAWVTQFKWWVGLAVRDELAIGRIANIETTGSTNIFDEDDLISLLNLGHFEGPGTTIYLNKTLATQAQIRLKDKGNVNWSVGEGLSGRPVMQFQGVPVRKMENNIIVNTETAVTS